MHKDMRSGKDIESQPLCSHVGAGQKSCEICAIRFMVYENKTSGLPEGSSLTSEINRMRAEIARLSGEGDTSDTNTNDRERVVKALGMQAELHDKRARCIASQLKCRNEEINVVEANKDAQHAARLVWSIRCTTCSMRHCHGCHNR